MQGLWRPPGQKPVSTSYSYDFGSGDWGVGAGQAGGTQFEMMPGQYPGAPAPDPSVMVHPPGVQAPVGAINYTPGTGEMHPPGMPAPIDQENLTLQSGPQMPGDGVDPSYAATALRQQPVPKSISPMRQAQEILALLGVESDTQPAVPTGAGQSSGPLVGSGQDTGVGATRDPSLTQLGATTNPSQYSQYASGPAQGYSTDDGSGDGPSIPEIHPVTGGYVTVDPMTGETQFYSTDGTKQKDNPWINVGGGSIFNTDTGEFKTVPQTQQQQAPTALGGGSYWNPQTGKIEQVPQSQQSNNQVVQNGDGTYSIIDLNTGQPVSQGGQQKPNMVQVQNQDGTTTVVDLNQITSGTTLGTPKNEPQNPMATPNGDIVVWDPQTGQYRKAFEQNRYTTNDGSIVDIQPDGSLKYVYKGQHQFTTPDGSIVSMDPESGQYTMPFTMPEEKAPGWEVRSIQKMFPDVFTDEALVGPDFTFSQPGGQPWKPDAPGPPRGSGVTNRPSAAGYSPQIGTQSFGTQPDLTGQGLDSFQSWMKMYQQSQGSKATYPGSDSMSPWDRASSSPDPRVQGLLHGASRSGQPYEPDVWDAGRGPDSFLPSQSNDPLSWNPFAGKGAPSWMTGGQVGSGQDVSINLSTGDGPPQQPPMYQPIAFGSQQPSGQTVGTGQDMGGGIVPPVDPSNVVGTGHRWMEPVGLEGQHKGVDLQAVRGTPAISPVDGTISRVEDDPAGLGIQVFVRGNDGVEHALGHLDSVDVQPGDSVSAGQPVGAVGDTGAGATGPHLDYRQIGPDGQHLDPTAQLGPLAQMPRADDGSEPGMPMGAGQASLWDANVGVGSEYMPYVPMDLTGGNGGGGSDMSFTPGGLSSFQVWVQMKLQEQQNQRQYEMDQQRAQQDWLVHQDNLKYQQDQLAAQTKYQQQQVQLQQQQNTLGPYMQAAFNNPWLTRLQGQTPNYGQVGGPGGPWAARLGANDRMQDMLTDSGAGPWPDHFPGWGKPDKRGKLGLSVPIADAAQAQYAYDPLKYGRMSDQSWTQQKIDAAVGQNRKSVPDITVPEGAPAGAENAFKWMPVVKGSKPYGGKGDFYEGAQGGVKRGDVRKGNIDFNTYAEMSPFQRTALRSDVAMNQQSWGDYTNQLRTNWGAQGGPTEMPGMTMLHSLEQTPIEKEGTNQLVDTFGSTPQDYMAQQQKLWTQSAQPSVLQRA